METKGITIYCASSDDIAPEYFAAAHRLGELVAAAGLPVINGGGKMGLMGAVTDGALSAGGRAVGIIPQFMVDADRHHKQLSEIVITDDMATRKRLLQQMSAGVVVLPGGVGTFEEMFETLTNRKLGFYRGKVVILNTCGYYDPMIAMLEKAEEAGFSYGSRMWDVADTPEQALEIILTD